MASVIDDKDKAEQYGNFICKNADQVWSSI